MFNSSVSLFSLFELIKETKKISIHVYSKLLYYLSRIKISVILSLGVSFHSYISAVSFFLSSFHCAYIHCVLSYKLKTNKTPALKC